MKGCVNLEVIKSVLIGLISFGILIATHELGHFTSALISKIKVSEFSIGFGPKILAKKVNGINYKLSMFPIGGYVKMPESEDEEGSDGVFFSQASSFAKFITLLAGSFSNILSGYLIILFIFVFFENGSFVFNTSGFLQNIQLGTSFFKDIIVIIFDSFKGLLVGEFGIADLSGPIGITTIIGESAKTSFSSYLIMLAFISINIGISNLLPIPALDGARALFVIVEVMFKKEFSVKLQERIHFVGLVALLALILIITVKDISTIAQMFLT